MEKILAGQEKVKMWVNTELLWLKWGKVIVETKRKTIVLVVLKDTQFENKI